MKTLFRSLLFLSCCTCLSAQDLGGHGEPDSNDTGTYRIDVSGPPGETAAVDIPSFGFGLFGLSFTFQAEPNKHYMVWQSGGLELWNSGDHGGPHRTGALFGTSASAFTDRGFQLFLSNRRGGSGTVSQSLANVRGP